MITEFQSGLAVGAGVALLLGAAGAAVFAANRKRPGTPPETEGSEARPQSLQGPSVLDGDAAALDGLPVPACRISDTGRVTAGRRGQQPSAHSGALHHPVH